MASRRVEDIFKTSSRCLQHNNILSSKTSWRRFQDVLQDVFKTSLQDVFKMFSRHLGRRKIVTLKMCWKCLQDMSSSPTNVFWGAICNNIARWGDNSGRFDIKQGYSRVNWFCWSWRSWLELCNFEKRQCFCQPCTCFLNLQCFKSISIHFGTLHNTRYYCISIVLNILESSCHFGGKAEH